MAPETRYARSGDLNIAYQVLGNGPLDLVFVMGWVSNIDEFWTEPHFARFLNRLASFTRLIVFDKRGTGLSDRVDEHSLPSLEQRMDDVRAVMDAAGSRRAALFGVSEGSGMCSLFAATHPERTVALLTFGGYALRCRADDYPIGPTTEEYKKWVDSLPALWGTPVGLEARIPSLAKDEAVRRWWTKYLTRSASPKAAATLLHMNHQIDIRNVLPAIRVPTLIMHSVGDRTLPVEGGRYMGRMIPGARYVEFDGEDHVPWGLEMDRVLDEIQEFLTGTRPAPELDRMLATILFADIAGSTELASKLGDRAWRDVLESYYAMARKELAYWKGKEVDTAGDGLFAQFDGPARAVRCAEALQRVASAQGFSLRAGLHTGEVEIIAGKAGGIAVHIGARVAAAARPGEVLVSSTVKDLVAGSGLTFVDAGRHVLKGIEGDWQLFKVGG